MNTKNLSATPGNPAAHVTTASVDYWSRDLGHDEHERSGLLNRLYKRWSMYRKRRELKRIEEEIRTLAGNDPRMIYELQVLYDVSEWREK